jgi:hypothetical protein
MLLNGLYAAEVCGMIEAVNMSASRRAIAA